MTTAPDGGGLTEAEAMSDAEGQAWDDLYNTDAARCCSCPACNFYAPDYEQHKDEPCLLTTIVERILAARSTAPDTEAIAAALESAADDWDTGLGTFVPNWLRDRAAAIREGSDT